MGASILPFAGILGRFDASNRFLQSLCACRAPSHRDDAGFSTPREDEAVGVVVAPRAKIHLVFVAVNHAQADLLFVVSDGFFKIESIDLNVGELREQIGHR